MKKTKHVNDYELFLEERRVSGAAKTAKDIREELKKVYPGVKFSVTSDTYSVVRVRYENGPKYSEVSQLLAKYEYGKFDPMTDYYDIKSDKEETAENTVKYVQVSRDINDMIESLVEVADIDRERARVILRDINIPLGAISIKSVSQDVINFRDGEIEYNYEEKETKSKTEKEKMDKPDKTDKKFTPKDRGDLRVIDYTEKSIAVVGNTFEVKDKLKELDARFNKFLTIDGEKQPGWILPKTKKDEVLNVLGLK